MTLTTDVLIAGAGMGGLVAARTAQEGGAQVLVLEKAPLVGGSAALSGGSVWTARDLEAWLSVQPEADPALGKAHLDGFSEGIRWLASQGIALQADTSPSVYRFPIVSYNLRPDARTALETLAARITGAGGTILVETALESAERDARGAVAGVRARGRDGAVEVKARAIVLATGGFQANKELRARYFGRWSDRMILRSNAYSTGGGLLAAIAAGADAAGPFSRFYGHLVPAPPAEVGMHNFTRVTPYFSGHGVLLNLRGERFCDEYLGDEVSVHAVAHQDEATAILVLDQRVRATYAGDPPEPDRLEATRLAGGVVLEAPSLTALVAAMMDRWNVPRAALATLDTYARAAASGDTSSLAVPRTGHLDPLATAPFYAVRYRAGITFTYGGARVNRRAQALDTTGKPIPGLYAAGADAGGVYTLGYAGGLSLGLAFGRIAGREAAAYARV